MNNKIKIVDLKSCPEFIPLLCRWFVEEWKFLPYQAEVDRLTKCCAADSIPLTLVALSGSEVVGTVGLILDDIEERPDISPWLASLYVAPPFRNQGVARMLIEAIVEKQTLLEIPSLYLFTSQTGLYQKFGWRDYEETIYQNQQVTIMVRRIEEIL